MLTDNQERALVEQLFKQVEKIEEREKERWKIEDYWRSKLIEAGFKEEEFKIDVRSKNNGII